jgi:hypothetical protein
MGRRAQKWSRYVGAEGPDSRGLEHLSVTGEWDDELNSVLVLRYLRSFTLCRPECSLRRERGG